MPTVRLRRKGLGRKLPPDASLVDRVRAGMEALAALRVTAERYRTKQELLGRLAAEAKEPRPNS